MKIVPANDGIMPTISVRKKRKRMLIAEYAITLGISPMPITVLVLNVSLWLDALVLLLLDAMHEKSLRVDG